MLDPDTLYIFMACFVLGSVSLNDSLLSSFLLAGDGSVYHGFFSHPTSITALGIHLSPLAVLAGFFSDAREVATLLRGFY